MSYYVLFVILVSYSLLKMYVVSVLVFELDEIFCNVKLVVNRLMSYENFIFICKYLVFQSEIVYTN